MEKINLKGALPVNQPKEKGGSLVLEENQTSRDYLIYFRNVNIPYPKGKRRMNEVVLEGFTVL